MNVVEVNLSHMRGANPVTMASNVIVNNDALKNIIIKNVTTTINNFFDEVITSSLSERTQSLIKSTDANIYQYDVVLMLVEDILQTNMENKKTQLLSNNEFFDWVTSSPLADVKEGIIGYFKKHDKALEMAINEPPINAYLKNTIFINKDYVFEYVYDEHVRPLFKDFLIESTNKVLQTNYFNNLNFIKGDKFTLEQLVQSHKNGLLELISV
jgi:hypothetical protein